MSLPGGYTELEYIQSSGTQYVDTGLKPNQDFGVTIDFQMTTVSGWQCIFGAANSAQNADEYGVWHNGTNFGFYYASTNVTVSAAATARHLFVCSKNTITVDGAAAGSPAYTSFQTNYPLLLGAINYAGSKMYGSQIKIYSAKIYQNGSLVRDFIPCKNAAGVIGLWDDVNSVFYQNAGSGVFTAGPEVRGTHKTLIGGTAYDVKSGKCLINGTAYAIQKGRTLINGTGYDIALISLKKHIITMSSDRDNINPNDSYVTINGTTYHPYPNYEIEVDGDVQITVGVYGSMGGSTITLNGVVVKQVSSFSEGSYTFELDGDCNIVFKYSGVGSRVSFNCAIVT